MGGLVEMVRGELGTCVRGPASVFTTSVYAKPPRGLNDVSSSLD